MRMRMSPLFLIAMAVFSICSCQSKAAFKFSEDIVQKEKSLTADITQTEEEVGRFAEEAKFDSVAIVSERMEEKVAAKIEEIKAMKTPVAKEAENFKTATLHYFSFIKSVYTHYKNVGLAKADEARQEAATKLTDIEARRDVAINLMQQAQQKFAKANGFRIEK